MGALEHGSMGFLVLWFFGSLVLWSNQILFFCSLARTTTTTSLLLFFGHTHSLTHHHDAHHHPPPPTTTHHPPPYPYTVNTTLSAAWLVVVGVVSRP